MKISQISLLLLLFIVVFLGVYSGSYNAVSQTPLPPFNPNFNPNLNPQPNPQPPTFQPIPVPTRNFPNFSPNPNPNPSPAPQPLPSPNIIPNPSPQPSPPTGGQPLARPGPTPIQPTLQPINNPRPGNLPGSGGVIFTTPPNFVPVQPLTPPAINVRGNAPAATGYTGDCGKGVFEDGPNDIFPSKTGCYNPEERFSYTALDEDRGRGDEGVPRDDVLNPHPRCMLRQSVLTKELYVGQEAIEVQCLYDDYIDDFDAYCRYFIDDTPPIDRYLKTRWDYNRGEECFQEREFPAVIDVFGFLPNGDPEHYMPLATYPVPGLVGAQRRDLGEYGYKDTRVDKDWVFDKDNIYNLDPIPETSEANPNVRSDRDTLNFNNMGTKLKRQECLRIFIEEWAHRGDCGEIVLSGARADVNEGYCQWVTKYDAADDFVESFVDENEFRRVNTDSRTPHIGMRSEYFDYESFRSASWLKAFEANSGFRDSNVCNLPTRPGDGVSFNPGIRASSNDNGSGLDFSKRGCPTTSGPNFWPREMNCNPNVGAARINAARGRGVDITTNINDPLSARWGLHTGGPFRIPIPTPPDPPGSFRGDPPPAHDWVDYSWPARSCMHPFPAILNHTSTALDQWRETPDYRHNISVQSGFLLSPGRRIFSWDVNPILLDEDVNLIPWCNFELPYYPYLSGQAKEDFIIGDRAEPPPPGPFSFFNQPDNPDPQDVARDTHDRINNTSNPNGFINRNFFHVIERIRDGCSAFSQRGTWTDDEERGINFAKFMNVAHDNRCSDWKGFVGREYDDPKTVSWRLPRFDYEFLKSFIECTGPIISIASELRMANTCAVTGTGDPAVCTNWHPSHLETDDQGNEFCVIDPPAPDMARPILPLPNFGFWCNCPADIGQTKYCNESFCTCPQANLGANASNTYCTDYGPFKRWLQCYYQARAKACPVLVRDISSGMPPASVLQSPAISDVSQWGKDPDLAQSFAVRNQPQPSNVCPDPNADPNPIPDWEPINLRWSAEEPNILALLPINSESGGQSKKHYDLVFQSAVQDNEPPFIEPMLPYPLTQGIPPGSQVNPVTVSSDVTVANLDRIQLEKSIAEATEGFNSTDSRAYDAIVGPRGCDIGGWYEMMLYQARCIKWFRLNCLCDYDKTFIQGSAEAYVLKRGGFVFDAVTPYIVDARGASGNLPAVPEHWEAVETPVSWPLMWRGYAGPEYAPNAVEGSKLWDKDADGEYDDEYLGLSEALPGDFVIFDETIEDEDGEDARYRRHIAYVEAVDDESQAGGDWIEISEWNWGKNQDSCGNTDRWKTRTSRTIYRIQVPAPVGPLSNCMDPDLKNCLEENWMRIKLYRPTLDVVDTEDDPDAAHPSRPICDVEDDVFPETFVDERLDIEGIPTKEESANMSPKQIILTGAYKRYFSGSFDGEEVADFLEQNLGTCEPPIDYRGFTNIVPKKQIQVLAINSGEECDNVGRCPDRDNSRYYMSPSNARITFRTVQPIDPDFGEGRPDRPEDAPPPGTSQPRSGSGGDSPGGSSGGSTGGSNPPGSTGSGSGSGDVICLCDAGDGLEPCPDCMVPGPNQECIPDPNDLDCEPINQGTFRECLENNNPLLAPGICCNRFQVEDFTACAGTTGIARCIQDPNLLCCSINTELPECERLNACAANPNVACCNEFPDIPGALGSNITQCLPGGSGTTPPTSGTGGCPTCQEPTSIPGICQPIIGCVP